MPVTVTPELAAGIVDAFGPCTALYECGGAEHVLEAAERHSTLNNLIHTLLACESVQAERMDDTGECYREWVASRPAIVARIERLTGQPLSEH